MFTHAAGQALISSTSQDPTIILHGGGSPARDAHIDTFLSSVGGCDRWRSICSRGLKSALLLAHFGGAYEGIDRSIGYVDAYCGSMPITCAQWNAMSPAEKQGRVLDVIPGSFEALPRIVAMVDRYCNSVALSTRYGGTIPASTFGARYGK